jgi:hypothetical protein
MFGKTLPWYGTGPLREHGRIHVDHGAPVFARKVDMTSPSLEAVKEQLRTHVNEWMNGAAHLEREYTNEGSTFRAGIEHVEGLIRGTAQVQTANFVIAGIDHAVTELTKAKAALDDSVMKATNWLNEV